MKKLSIVLLLLLGPACSAGAKASSPNDSEPSEEKAKIHSVLVGKVRMSINEISYKGSNFVCIINDYGDGQMWCERS